MSLLTTMIQRPLDPGYASAADRRESQGRPRATSLRAPRLIIAMIALGLLVGVAASNLTASDSPRAQARQDLIVQIEERRAEVDDLPLHPGFAAAWPALRAIIEGETSS